MCVLIGWVGLDLNRDEKELRCCADETKQRKTSGKLLCIVHPVEWGRCKLTLTKVDNCICV
jgi:hypothetical protein